MIRSQFVPSEWAEMVYVGIERAGQRGALVNQPNAGVTPAMDSPLVAFG